MLALPHIEASTIGAPRRRTR